MLPNPFNNCCLWEAHFASLCFKGATITPCFDVDDAAAAFAGAGAGTVAPVTAAAAAAAENTADGIAGTAAGDTAQDKTIWSCS